MDKERNLQLGMGYHLKRIADRKVIKISIPASHRTSHMWVFGTTRVGKTKLLESIIEQDIPAGLSVVIIDPKGDDGLFSKVVQVAKKCGRLSDLMLFTPIFPECSVHFNPLKHFYMIEEQVAHIISGIAAGKEPFFKNVTLMAINVASLIPKKNCRVLIICPGHLVKKWKREIISTDKNHGEIRILYKISDINLEAPIGREYWIIGKEKAKLHYSLKKVYHYSRRKGICCPSCYSPLDEEEKDANKCSKENCGSKFTTADNTKFRRFALADYIRRKKNLCRIEMLIADEVHELKGGDTAQGQAFHALCVASNKTLALTGTLMGGYASNLYYLLFRMFSKKFIERGYKHNSSSKFSTDFGVVEEVVEQKVLNDRIASLAKVKQTRKIKEKPGISPLLLPEFLLENTVYVWVSDISDALPSYDEYVEIVPMTDEQSHVYKLFERDLQRVVYEALAKRDNRLLGALVNSLFALPDGARRGEMVFDPDAKAHGVEQVLCSAEPLYLDILPKEEKLIELVLEEKSKGRKVAIFLEHTGTRDLIPDLEERLSRNGISALVLRSNTVPTDKREEWLTKNIESENPDVLICNPSLVKTGLDLLSFPTIIYFQVGFNVYTLRQSSRRSWRIGQTQDVKVIYLAYSNTAQSRALNLIANKLETSNAVEGKFSADGLTKMSSSSDSSLLFALAKELVGNKSVNDNEIKRNFAKYRSSESVQDRSLATSDTFVEDQFKELYNKVFTIISPYRAEEDNAVICESDSVSSVEISDLQSDTVSICKEKKSTNFLAKASMLFDNNRQLTVEDFLSLC